MQPHVNTTIKGAISTKNVTNVTVAIRDPHDWIKNRTEKVSFYWEISERRTRNTTVCSLVLLFLTGKEMLLSADVTQTLQLLSK